MMSSSGLRAALLVAAATASVAMAEEPPLAELSLEELMALPVVSPSRTAERLIDAPATVIVVTRQEIAERGYGDLTELLDDLPGMDVVRPRGATYFKSYWRGFRNNIGSPYLLLLDGMVLNHLYFHTDDVLVAVPLSAVERVEVVYGPASAVYGANAFTGVIQVITGHAPAAAGAARLHLEAGETDRRLADGFWRRQLGGWSLSLAARRAELDLDRGSALQYPYSRPELLSDRRLWGGWVDDGRLAGRFSSPERHRGADLRAQWSPAERRGEEVAPGGDPASGKGGDGLELALQHFETSTGYGFEYAFDASQPRAEWTRADRSAWLRLRRELRPGLASCSLFRYRESTVEDSSTFVEGFPDVESRRLVGFSRWRADNRSWGVFQDFELRLDEGRLVLLAGGRWEHQDLQKEYATAFGPALAPSQLDPATYPFPSRGDVAGPPRNRVEDDELAVYGEAKWRPLPAHGLHLGVRRDGSSAYDSPVTVRAGYAGSFGRWVVKALYGEGFQEPNQRVLYGGWRGSGSDPTLDPERSRTWEASLAHTRPASRHLLSIWRMENRDTIVNTGIGSDGGPGARNLGAREVAGLDYHFEALPRVAWLDTLRLWVFWSHLFTAEEERFAADGSPLPDGAIGDLAKDKMWLGMTATRRRLTANLRARWIDRRPTVASNPVREVDGFATADLFVRYRLGRDVRLGLKMTNLSDERYFHPGVRDASAGATPGFFDASGHWIGSQGFFSSLLPQPGRQLSLVLGWGGG